MIEFGKTLREAREAKGLTIEDIAKATHMMTRQIKALEEEDFSLFAAPIYGRGFVKLYCEVVGLDAEKMIAAFMEVYNGYQEPVIQLREEEPSVSPASEQEPEEMPSALPEAEQTAEPPTIVQPTFDDPIPASQPTARPPYAEHVPSRYAAPTPIDEKPTKMNISFLWIWRPLFLLACVVAVVWLLICGVRALFRTTGTTEAAPTTEESAAQPATRGKITVDPLYLD